jgi:hypothetical protein
MNVHSKNSANDVITLQGTVDGKPKHAATLSFKEQAVSTEIASHWILELYTAGWPKQIRVDLRPNCDDCIARD